MKELCDERLVLKNMSASSDPNVSISPEFLKTDPVPEASTSNGLVPRNAKTNNKSYNSETCEAEEKEPCGAGHKELTDLQKKTTTLYTDKPVMVLPSDELGGASAMFNPDDGTDQFF